MNLFDIIMLALALSIDACAVSFGWGLLFNKNKIRNALLLALFTGFFQFLMPVMGYFLADLIYSFVKPFASFVAFIIFMILGLKFIYDALFDKNSDKKVPLCLSFACLLSIALTASIDALVAGVNLRFMDVNILKSSLVIGIVTFINSLSGCFLGHLFKKFPSKYLEILSGLVLVALAIKALL